MMPSRLHAKENPTNVDNLPTIDSLRLMIIAASMMCTRPKFEPQRAIEYMLLPLAELLFEQMKVLAKGKYWIVDTVDPFSVYWVSQILQHDIRNNKLIFRLQLVDSIVPHIRGVEYPTFSFDHLFAYLSGHIRSFGSVHGFFALDKPTPLALDMEVFEHRGKGFDKILPLLTEINASFRRFVDNFNIMKTEKPRSHHIVNFRILTEGFKNVCASIDLVLFWLDHPDICYSKKNALLSDLSVYRFQSYISIGYLNYLQTKTHSAHSYYQKAIELSVVDKRATISTKRLLRILLLQNLMYAENWRLFDLDIADAAEYLLRTDAENDLPVKAFATACVAKVEETKTRPVF